MTGGIHYFIRKLKTKIGVIPKSRFKYLCYGSTVIKVDPGTVEVKICIMAVDP